MDALQECAKAFARLLPIEYRIILGRKGKLTEIHLVFQDTDFHHLAGLHKLRDLHLARQNRAQVLRDIQRGGITLADVKKSQSYGLVDNRIDPLTHLEQLLDTNQVVFKYSPGHNGMSRIQAEYLLSTPWRANDIYLFLDLRNGSEPYCCRSFFPKERTDYTTGQTKFALLYKEKINHKTGETVVQYDKLTPKTPAKNG